MKKYIVILICHCLCSCMYAQNAVISLDKMHTLYIGIDNPIEFAADKYDCKDLKVISNNFTIKCNDTCKCAARTSTQGIFPLIILNKENKPIDTVVFRTKMIPDPQTILFNQTGGKVGCSTIFEWKELELKTGDYNFDAPYRIVSFSVFYDEKGRWPYYIRNQGSVFGRDLKIIMNKIKPGDLITFEDVKVIGPDNFTRKIPGIAFKIEE